MLIHPVIRRELQAAVRKRSLRATRLGIAAIGCGICILCMLLDTSGSPAGGRNMHQWLYLLGLYAGVFLPAGNAIGLFSEERRSQTLDLLFLAGMTAFELFVTKLAGGLLVAATQLLAVAPLLAIPMLAGGVSFDLFLATVATLPALMIFTVATSMLASVACKDDSVAMFACVILISLLCALTPVPFFLGKALTGAAPFSATWLVLSPAYGPWNLGFNLTVPPLIWENIGATLVWAFAALLIAGHTLNRTWRTDDVHASGWFWQWWLNRVQGADDLRKRLRDQVLPWKPFQWFVRSHRKPEAVATAVITSVVVLWLIGWAAWPAHWPSTANFFLTAVLLISAMDIIAMHAAARHFAEARQSGAFEILLTTPLSPDEIADGLTGGIREQLRPLRQKVFLLCLLMAVAGLACRSWNIAGLITYALVWTLLLLWCRSGRIGAMTSSAWVALNTGRTMFALTRTSGFVGWQFIWIVFNLKNLGGLISSGASGFPNGSTGEVVFVVFVAVVFAIIIGARHGQPAAERFLLIRHMRSIAALPIPGRDDPRLKGWKWRDEPLG